MHTYPCGPGKHMLATELAIASFLMVDPAMAKVTSEPVLAEEIVTVRKRTERLLHTPGSIGVIEGTRLDEANLNDLEALQDAIPNLQVSRGIRTRRVYIRGQGSTSNAGFEQSVGWFVDGVYGGRGDQFLAPFFDVAAVEVLRGPQGTVLGKNITSGAISVATRRPTSEPEGRITGLYEQQTGERQLETAISGPLTSALDGRLALLGSDDNGWVEDNVSGEKVDQKNIRLARLSLLWNATDNLELFFKAEDSSVRIDFPDYQLSVPGAGLQPLIDAGLEEAEIDDRSSLSLVCSRADIAAVYSDFACRDRDRAFFDTDSRNYNLTIEYQRQGFQITSITGWSEYDTSRLVDADFIGSLYMIDDSQEETFEQISQELRIRSIGDATLEWMGGLYYQDNDLGILSQNLFGDIPGVGLFPLLMQNRFDQQSEVLSGFLETSWKLAPDTRLVLGARYTEEDKDGSHELRDFNAFTGLVLDTMDTGDAYVLGAADCALGSTTRMSLDDRTDLCAGGRPALPPPQFVAAVLSTGIAQNPTLLSDVIHEEELTLAATIEQDWADHLLYFSVSEGFKAGGFDAFILDDNSRGTFTYAPEKALAFELGGKFLFADGAADLSIALFLTKYDDLQISTFVNPVFAVSNAASSTSRGVEAEVSWRLNEKLRLGTALSYLDSKFDDYKNAACDALTAAATVGECTSDLSGRTTPFAPRWSGNAHLTYEKPVLDGTLVFSARVDLYYSDDFFYQTDLDPFDTQEAYTKWDMRLALTTPDQIWQLAFIGKNLSDELTVTMGGDVPLVTGAHEVVIGAPRTLAVQASYRF